MNKEEAIKLLRMYEIDEYGEAGLHTWYKGIDKDMHEALDMAISALSAERVGEWVLNPNGYDWNLPAWCCSECGCINANIGVSTKGITSNPMNWAGSKFCPNCGAKMKGDNE